MSKIVNRENLKAFRQKLDDKYVIEGEYSPETKVGYADESGALTPYGDNSGASDTTPFVFQTSGGSSDIGSLGYLKSLRGNSVAWNQLTANGNFASDTGIYIPESAYLSKSVANNKLTLTVTQNFSSGVNTLVATKITNGHTYLIKCSVKSLSNNNKVSFNVYGSTYSAAETINQGETKMVGAILTANGDNTNTTIRFVGPASVGDSIEVSNLQTFDLTLLGTNYTSVLDFNRDYPLPYYAYNAGELLSSKSNGYKIVGYNAFDGELELGSIRTDDGTNNDSYTSVSRSKNYIKVIQGQECTLELPSSIAVILYYYDGNKNFIGYYGTTASSLEITLGDNVCYIRFVLGTTTLSTNVCFHLTWDGSKTGYEEYYSETYALPNVELRSAGSVYDELKPDGTLIRRVGVVDLGSLSGWGYAGSNSDLILNALSLASLIKKPSADNVKANIYCSKYITDTTNNVYTKTTDMTISVSSTGRIYIWDKSANITSSTTEAQIKEYLSGVYLFYELATPTTEQTNNTFQESTKIDDYGTQEFLSSDSIVIPQDNEFFYPVDYKAFVDSLGGREDIEYDASQVVSQTELSASETQRDTVDSQLKEALGGLLCQTLSLSASLDVLNIDYIDLGSLTWTSYGAYGNGNLFYVSLSGQKIPSSGSTIPNCLITKKYKLTSSNGIQTDKYNKNYALLTNGQLWIIDSSYSTADTFKTAMKGVLLAYEKA